MVNSNEHGSSKGFIEEGVYEYKDNYNFEAYLMELGVPWYMRKLAQYANPTVTIKKINESSGR